MLLQHPQLGAIQGREKGQTSQFLGIQYASLIHGFAVAELKEKYLDDKIDATKLSPTVVSPPFLENEVSIIQQTLPAPPFPGMSATEGLSLNITVPKGTAPDARLPVVVFIHGGAFLVGSSYFPHYDGEGIVSLSVEAKKPIIFVAINYRLGAHGFLDSQALRDAGFPANRGLRDQWTAFRWIKKFIGGFGGNPDAVTAVGQSAGSMSVLLALASPEPLFNNAMCMSGNLLNFQFPPLSVAEYNADAVFSHLGLADLPADERLTRLTATSAEDILTKIPFFGVHLGPTVDDVTVKPVPTYAGLTSSLATNMPGTKWCKRLLIGSTDYDAQIFSFMGLFNDRGPLAAAFIDGLKKTVSSDKLDELLACYGLTRDTPDEAAQRAILQYGSDVKYFATGLEYAQAWPGDVYLYQFKEGNPWEGLFKGRAGHTLDVAFLLQNYNDRLEAEQRELATQYGRDLISFAHQEDPFPSFGKDRGARVYKCGASTSYETDLNALQPSATVRSLWDAIGLQELSLGWDLFVMRQS